ncbi:hypothetical protein DY000_02020846 [Brassica cretica]|uniref:Uncharacterized protein n=1 Tax=Brassica cretica TaxID=69181 RepID=A0ABQ7E3Q7_BRACR|nr:hypothetical protein DY000_02020846 [Brassica cretica]
MRSPGCRPPSLASSVEKEAYAKVAVASSKVMVAFNEYVVVMEDHVVASRNDKEIESIGSEIKRLSKELKATKREGKKDVEKIEALTEDWKRIHQENEALMTQMVAQKARIAALQLYEVIANIDLLNELKGGDLTVDAELARLKEMKGDCEDLVAVAMSDWSISELDLPQVSDDSVDQPSRFSLFGSLRYGEALILIKLHFVLGFTIVANAKHIRSGDVSEALTEVLREETRIPRTSTQEAKDLEGEKSVARVKSSSQTAAVAKPFHWQLSHSNDCPITEDSDSVAHLVRHFKPAGCLLPSLRNMTKHEAYVKMVVAHAKAMEANNEFAATVEKCLQDVSRSDELYEIKKVVRELKIGLKMAQDRERANAAQLAAAEKLGNQATSLEARLRVVSNERKSALEQVSFLEAKVESSANKFSDDLRRATYDAKKALADSYLDVLVSLKQKWEKKKAATDCEARLREVELGSELDVMAISDFSVGKLNLPQISEDLPEDFFAKVPSVADDVTKCSGGQFEDGEFGIEE